MKNGKFAKRGSKTLVMVLALVLVIGCTVGGTIAWLTDTTDEVKNTFSTSDITITLEETTTDYKMVPGITITKDPVVTVEGGSEACWLFVKVAESDNLDTYITYTIADGWTNLEDGVYYRAVEASDADQEFEVLAGSEVTVLDSVTKDDMAAAEENAPTLTFTAYAIQQFKFDTAEEAWAELNK